MASSSTGSRPLMLAFVAGPLAGTAVIAAIYIAITSRNTLTSVGDVVTLFLNVMVYTDVFAATTALVLGVPAFLLLRRLDRLTAPWCTFVGGLLASVPLMTLIVATDPISSAASPEGLLVFAMLFVGGAVGGWVFWRVQKAGEPRERGHSRASLSGPYA